MELVSIKRFIKGVITILNGSNISWHDEVACTTEDSRNVQERLDDVLDFIDKYGNVYNHRIKQALKKFDNKGASHEEILCKRYSMYERLSNL